MKMWISLVMWATELDTRYKFIKLDMSTGVNEQIDLRKPSLIYQISLVFWATELDTSLSSSICQPASIPSSRPLTFTGGQSKNGYRAR